MSLVISLINADLVYPDKTQAAIEIAFQCVRQNICCMCLCNETPNSKTIYKPKLNYKGTRFGCQWPYKL